MNDQEKTLARILFSNKVAYSDGQQYENLFVQIMRYAFTNFQPVKPHGNNGDRKNDGFDGYEGRYFQVYAPEDINKLPTKYDALKKARDDFSGLKEYWESIYPIKEFFFVLNDKYRGGIPELHSLLHEIKEQNALQKCELFLNKDLEKVLFTLPDDLIQSSIGFIPKPENIRKIDFSILKEVINHVLQNEMPFDLMKIKDPPDFNKKILFNNLLITQPLLINASYQVGMLDKYFELNSDFVKQQLRDIFNGLYKNMLTKEYDLKLYPENINKADLVFFEILNATVPNSDKRTQDAALVLMAYFFETCDIFEDPDKNKDDNECSYLQSTFDFPNL